MRENDSTFELNEADGYALEEALRLKDEQGGEAVAVSVGPARVMQVLREALGKGADRGIHILDDDYQTREPFRIAEMIAAAIRRERFDLLLTGLQSDDQGFGQTGVILAELLDVAHVSLAVEILSNERRLRVKRELERGRVQWIESSLPAVVTVQSGINKPRYATMRGMMQAKKKTIDKLERGELGLTETADSQQLVRLEQPEETRDVELLEVQDPRKAVDWLVQKLGSVKLGD